MYPALAVLKALQEGVPDEGRSGVKVPSQGNLNARPDRKSDPLEILWVGGIDGMEVALLTREGIPLVTIPAAGIHGVGWRALPGNLMQIIRGFLSARGIIQQFRPSVMFFTGGYLAVPVALAGRMAGRKAHHPKTLLYVPDIEPGLALRALARLADHIAVSTEESMSYFPKSMPLTVTGYPTRRELTSWSREDARRTLNLYQDLPTLLVFGGSKGARSINQAVLANLPALLENVQIVHISGHLDWEMVKNAHMELKVDLASRYHPYPYLHQEMGAALVAADLVLSRAGAAILGEYPLFGLPAILVPYPYAWRYQEVNAQYLEKQGAAVVIEDEVLSAKLLEVVKGLLNDRPRFVSMRMAMASLARPQAAETIARLILEMASQVSQGRN